MMDNEDVSGASGLSGGLLEKLMQMQNEMRNVQAELAGEKITISVGGDAVQVVIDGQQRVHHILVSDESVAAAQPGREMVVDIHVAAHNHYPGQSQILAAG